VAGTQAEAEAGMIGLCGFPVCIIFKSILLRKDYKLSIQSDDYLQILM
jgi:hypothetical protein